jgi:putative DNA primase/helicase
MRGLPVTAKKQEGVLPFASRAARENTSKKCATLERITIRRSDGTAKRNLANVMAVFATHPAWDGVLAYDAFAESVVCLKAPPARATDAAADRILGHWSEEDCTRTAAWFSSELGFDPTPDMIHAAATAIAHRHRVHPVVDYLRVLDWDRTPRLDTILSRYFGASDTDYTRAVGARWMISAVARVMRPGCQADCMIVLESKQGRGKSTGLEALVGPQWFADTPLAIGEKDAFQSLRGKWVVEIAELDAFKNREATKVKAFVSARSDNYRQSYGRRNRDFPRQCVFAGSTNEREYLVDHTGNRRFWPIQSTRAVDVEGIRRDRDQLWAEACHRFDAGEAWHVDTPALRRLCETEQDARTPIDAWTSAIAKWLAERMSKDTIDRSGVTTVEVLRGAIGLEADRIGRSEETRAGIILRELKWFSQQITENGARVRRYFPAQPVDEDPMVVEGRCAAGSASNDQESQPEQRAQPMCMHPPRAGTSSVGTEAGRERCVVEEDDDSRYDASKRPGSA